MSKLSERTMLVSVHRSGWSGTKIDQAISADTRQRNNAKQGAGNFTKILVNPKFFACVTRPMSQANDAWKRLSLPWGSNGERIMSNLAHPQFAREIRGAKDELAKGKQELANYKGDIHNEAQLRLGDMYDRAEYPEMEEIVSRFDIDVELRPVPEGGDFRCSLANETVKAIVKDIEQRNKERLEKANKAVFERVFNVVNTLTTTLKKYSPKTDDSKGKNFKNSLVYNVQEVADLIPTLNITLDSRLDDLRVEVVDELAKVPAEILKQSSAARESTIDKADRLLAKIAGYMS